MAKARARAAARKVKDKWRAKNWYNILAPTLFDNVIVAETLAGEPNSLIGRVTQASLQDITNDFRKAHIKLFFKISNIEGENAHTVFHGHSLTSDYLRRMVRRRRSRIDGVYDVETRDGARIRAKPFAITDRRIQNSQKRLIRGAMKNTLATVAKQKTLNSFLKDSFEGKLGTEIYKHCKNLYPVRRVEIYKTEVLQLPTVHIEDEPEEKKPEKPTTPKEQPPQKPETKEPAKPKDEEKPAEKPKKEPTVEAKKAEPEKPKKETKKPAKKTKPASKTTKKTATKTKKTTKAKSTKTKKTATKAKTTKAKAKK